MFCFGFLWDRFRRNFSLIDILGLTLASWRHLQLIHSAGPFNLVLHHSCIETFKLSLTFFHWKFTWKLLLQKVILTVIFRFFKRWVNLLTLFRIKLVLMRHFILDREFIWFFQWRFYSLIFYELSMSIFSMTIEKLIIFLRRFFLKTVF